jgi:hypothetical protein
MPRLSTPVSSSLLPCMLVGLPTPSSVQSTPENDGITLPAWCRRIAVTYGARSIVAKSDRLVTVLPWSIVKSPLPVPNSVSPSPAKCFTVASTPPSRSPSTAVVIRDTRPGSSAKLS